MPVSKKRKKGGKPVHRAAPPPPAEAQPGGEKAEAPPQRVGKPSNPFVAQQSQHRGAFRGR
ncbi:MAG TPA: hypothetical protein VFR85_20645 [Anaeromyxobacteraceae bacterium]|nr:hypothetical protein [Anaeromyxobacteraceae bacterium]